MTKLCPRGKAAAKRKFKVYPSAYANAYASKICAGKIKDPSGVKRKDFRGPKPAGKVAGGMIVRVGKAGAKYLKSKEGREKVKNIMEGSLPKKTSELLKKFKSAVTKKKGGGMTAGSMSGMGRLQKARMMNKGGGANTRDRLAESDIEKAKRLVKSPRQNLQKKYIMAALKGARDFRSAYNRDEAKVKKNKGGFNKKKIKKSIDPRKGLEFKKGTPPKGTSDHLGNPVVVREASKGGMADYYKDLM